MKRKVAYLIIIERSFLSNLHKNLSVCCGCSLELPCQGNSNEHPQHIGFYEEISKIIPQLSSNKLKYAPYLFF